MYVGPLRGELRVPIEPERLGVLIGNKGKVKKKIEEALNVELEVDSKNSLVKIRLKEGATIMNLLKARDLVMAISYGFSPERAFRLLDESQVLDVINLKEIAKGREDMKRIKGRVIGKEGKARAMIEDLTGACISVYDKYIAIIGDYEQVRVAREAVMMLVRGRQHRTVYNFLRREYRRLREKKYQLWEPGF
mgnify:CR=1 FL=1